MCLERRVNGGYNEGLGRGIFILIVYIFVSFLNFDR